jgi:hypothetical protein
VLPRYSIIILPIFTNITIPTRARILDPDAMPTYSTYSTSLLNAVSPQNLGSQSNLTIEVLSPQRLEQLSNPVQLSIPMDELASLYGIVVAAIIGWFVPSIAGWFNAKRQRSYLGRNMTAIDDVFRTSNQDKGDYLKRLEEIRKNIEQSFTKGKISESQYEILNNKISDHENKSSKP